MWVGIGFCVISYVVKLNPELLKSLSLSSHFIIFHIPSSTSVFLHLHLTFRLLIGYTTLTYHSPSPHSLVHSLVSSHLVNIYIHTCTSFHFMVSKNYLIPSFPSSLASLISPLISLSNVPPLSNSLSSFPVASSTPYSSFLSLLPSSLSPTPSTHGVTAKTLRISHLILPLPRLPPV